MAANLLLVAGAVAAVWFGSGLIARLTASRMVDEVCDQVYQAAYQDLPADHPDHDARLSPAEYAVWDMLSGPGHQSRNGTRT